MILGFFTDPHARLDNPGCRADFFPRTIISKFEMMGEIWKKHGVQLVLNGGDTTHIPSPSLSLVHDLSRVIRDWQLPMIAITGSHDVHGYQIQTLRRTAIGVLVKAGLMDIVGSEGFPKYVDVDPKVRVYGIPHTYDFADKPEVLNISDDERYNKFIIQLVHGDLVDHAVPWPHVLIETVKSDAQLILSGHYHPGWKDPKQYGATVFVNPGSIGRIEHGVFRMPRILIINTDEQNCRFVELPCEQHPFLEKESTDKQEVVVDVNRFISLLDQAQIQVVDVKGKVPVIGKELGLSDEIIGRTIQLLEEGSNA